uniref:Uncharacterized protein n=1 Tax=Romanomermis culicivorax TaxID=13658 RepID=A0A915KTA1_ROMCU
MFNDNRAVKSSKYFSTQRSTSYSFLVRQSLWKSTFKTEKPVSQKLCHICGSAAQLLDGFDVLCIKKRKTAKVDPVAWARILASRIRVISKKTLYILDKALVNNNRKVESCPVPVTLSGKERPKTEESTAHSSVKKCHPSSCLAHIFKHQPIMTPKTSKN